jgi:hypothetical protein
MKETRKNIPKEITSDNIPESCHVCLIYDSDGQRRKIVSEYAAAGIRRNELVRYMTDTTAPEQIRSWLLETGVDLPAAEEKGLFAIVGADKTYCPSGQFDPQGMIDRQVLRYHEAEKAGCTGTRATGEMTWVFRGIPGSERLLEYEALLNTIDTPFPHSGMCQYDAHRFDGATLYQVLQVHPYVIANGQIVRNPYYVKPQEFLAGLRQR